MPPQEEIRRVRRLINRVKADLDDLPEDDSMSSATSASRRADGDRGRRRVVSAADPKDRTSIYGGG